MKSLHINCPHCRTECELFLKKKPYIAVLTCPDCGATLLYGEGQTHNVQAPEQKPVAVNQHTAAHEHSFIPLPSPKETKNTFTPMHKQGEPVRKSPISQDDLVNLTIELEKSIDVQDFIDNI